MLNEFVRESDASERKQLHCAVCKRQTIHNLEARCRANWHEEYVSGGESYSILRCGGCDAVCYETVSWCTEDVEYDEDNKPHYGLTALQYPSPVSAQYNFNLESTPYALNSILDEMLYAMAGSKMNLATIGLRLAVEFIVKDKKCKGGNLKARIADLLVKKLIDEDQEQILQSIRDKGNAGAHKAVSMTAKELVAGMSVIEGLLEKLYNGPARHALTIRRAKQLLKGNNLDIHDEG